MMGIWFMKTHTQACYIVIFTLKELSFINGWKSRCSVPDVIYLSQSEDINYSSLLGNRSPQVFVSCYDCKRILKLPEGHQLPHGKVENSQVFALCLVIMTSIFF